jgi:hypothetical protein
VNCKAKKSPAPRISALAGLAFLTARLVNAQGTLVTVVPDADSFVRSFAPNSNYGAAGFTFNSRNFGNTNAQPLLEVTAMANPKPRIDNLVVVGRNIQLSFGVATNYTCRLQRAISFQGVSNGAWRTY